MWCGLLIDSKAALIANALTSGCTVASARRRFSNTFLFGLQGPIYAESGGSHNDPRMSPDTERKIDAEVLRIVKEAYARAADCLVRLPYRVEVSTDHLEECRHGKQDPCRGVAYREKGLRVRR